MAFCKDTIRAYLNGIDAETGQYLVEPMEIQQAAAIAKGSKEDPGIVSWLQSMARTVSRPHLGLRYDADPTSLSDAGWGIVFHENESRAVKEALKPLLDHRRNQVGDEGKVKELVYRPGQSRAQWLAAHGIGAGTVDPTRVPFYLLAVGSPDQIPFGFCQELDVEYGVGRLHFEKPGEYAQYAQSILNYETAHSIRNSREVVFFAVRHDFDPATQMSADLLVNPLADGAGGSTPDAGVAERLGFKTRKIWGAHATKNALAGVLCARSVDKIPSLLFTASHGMGWAKPHAQQPQTQGALLCQDWPGFGDVGPEHYFAAGDLPADAQVHGMIGFHFACFSAGTPAFDNFLHRPGAPPPRIAEKPFLAALPKALLAHSRGGALACIGHVERASGYSICAPNAGPQLLPFQNAIGRLLAGQPVGYAMKDFNERFASLSTSLSNLLEQVGFGVPVPDFELATHWVERNDAGGYIIVGDPAVRLRVNDMKR